MNIHPNFKKGHENMMKIASTPKAQKSYKEAQARARHKALKLFKSKADRKNFISDKRSYAQRSSEYEAKNPGKLYRNRD